MEKNKSQNFETHSEATTSSGSNPDYVQELKIKLLKNPTTKWNVMRFNSKDFVELSQWQHVKMWRDKVSEQAEKDAPKYVPRGRFRKRRTQDGSAELKPWILNINGKKGKKFRGVRAGGIGQHSTFFLFKNSPDGSIEAHRLEEFYNFHPISRFTPLTAEEAEEEYGRRKRVLNLFSIMTRKRLNGESKEAELEEESKTNAKKSAADLKISDMDEWMSSSDCESETDVDEAESKKKKSTEDDNEDTEKEKKRKQQRAQGNVKSNKKRKNNPDHEEAFEESDDGDGDGREMDYQSDSSEGEPDIEAKCAMKSVAEEAALRKLLTSDEDSSETEENSTEKKENKNENSKTVEKGDENTKDQKSLVSKKNSTSKSNKAAKAMESGKQVKEHKNLPNVVASAVKSVSMKSVLLNMNSLPKDETEEMKNSATATSTVVQASNNNDVNFQLEETTKRYLTRKPMSSVELLHKIKTKFADLPNDVLVEKMSHVLKKIDPSKSIMKGKMYFTLKKDKY